MPNDHLEAVEGSLITDSVISGIYSKTPSGTINERYQSDGN